MLSSFLINNDLTTFAHHEWDGLKFTNPYDYGLFDLVVARFGEGAAWEILLAWFPRNPAAQHWSARASRPKEFDLWDAEADKITGFAHTAENWVKTPYASIPYDTFKGLRMTPWDFIYLYRLGYFEQ